MRKMNLQATGNFLYVECVIKVKSSEKDSDLVYV